MRVDQLSSGPGGAGWIHQGALTAPHAPHAAPAQLVAVAFLETVGFGMAKDGKDGKDGRC